MSRVRIFEMFLRDGLQSYKRKFNISQKQSFLHHLNKVRYDCIEFGSTTSPKLIPQLEGSYELWHSIQSNKSESLSTKYTMLVPSKNHLEKVISEGINSVGLVTSISDTFSQKNMKMTSDESFAKAMEIIKIILDSNRSRYHIRVYISCSFGCPWEGFTSEHKMKLKYFMNSLVKLANKYELLPEQFDIVIADTTGMCDSFRMKEIVSIIDSNKYIALHLHFLGRLNKQNRLEQKFDTVVDIALDSGVEKFDTSLLGIGGCPYAKKNDGDIIGNLSTLPFVKYLDTKGIATNLDIEALEKAEFNIYREMNDK